MKTQSPLRQPAVVEMHLDGGFTRVVLFQLSDGHHRVDIPTTRIPLHLRGLGSRFVVVMPRFTPEAGDSPDTIRELCAQVRIEELREND